MRFRDASEAAHAVLGACQRGERPDSGALDVLLQGSPAVLFSHVVEPLCDAFDPAWCDAYADLFCEVIARSGAGEARELRERYESIRHTRRFTGDAADVVVLSRVTLGADIAVTSVMLDAAKRRFPAARIHFAGPAKNYELFDADPRILHLPIPYVRHGSLAERLRAGMNLGEQLPAEALVIDPDSRLTQLGLLPVTTPERHLFFESRGAGGDSRLSLGTLARRWAAEVLGVENAAAFLAIKSAPVPTQGRATVTISLGVGENPAKRVADPFEAELFRALQDTGRPILADLGVGGEEEERVRRAATGTRTAFWRGAFANFAASIGESGLYIGYDSSGQHAAAALGTPRITVLAGYPNERFLARWQPEGRGESVAVPASANAAQTLEQVCAAIRRLAPPPSLPPPSPHPAP